MVHVKIVIDGETKVDGDLGEWVKRGPEEIRQYLNRDANADPAIVALMTVATDAALKRKPLSATLDHRMGGWTLAVTYEGGGRTPPRPASSHGVLQRLHQKAGGQAGQHFAADVVSRAAAPFAPTHCPGPDDPRCKGLCTVDGRTGEIRDPNCFRDVILGPGGSGE